MVIKRLLWLLALLGALLLSAAQLPADDGFYVIAGRPAVGTRITSLPYEIKTSGYYYLAGNLSYAGVNDAITVSVDNVTLDLMGFALIGPGSSNAGSGVLIKTNNVEVRNGTITGFFTGVYGQNGSYLDAIGNRVIGVRGHGNLNGILLGGYNHLIKGCSVSPGTLVSQNSSYGLFLTVGTISGCTASGFNTSAIEIGYGTVSDNVVLNCPGIGIYGLANASILHNQVSNCATGIDGSAGGSIIGNVVYTTSGNHGIVLSTDPKISIPNILDQNNVSGDGARYDSGNPGTVWGLNGGK